MAIQEFTIVTQRRIVIQKITTVAQRFSPMTQAYISGLVAYRESPKRSRPRVRLLKPSFTTIDPVFLPREPLSLSDQLARPQGTYYDLVHRASIEYIHVTLGFKGFALWLSQRIYKVDLSRHNRVSTWRIYIFQ